MTSATESLAKVYQCPRCSTSMEVDPTAKPAPQPAASVDVEGNYVSALRAILAVAERRDTPEFNAISDAARHALIDSAGGAKDEHDTFGMMPAPITNTEAWPVNYANGWNDACRMMLDAMPAEARTRFKGNTPQPAEGDEAVDDTVNILGNVAFADDWFAQFMVEGVMFLAPLDNKEQARHILAAKKRRPAATEAVPEIRSCRDAFESYIAKDGGDLRTFGFGQSTHYSNSAVNNAWSGWQAGVKWAAAAPAAPKGGVVDDAMIKRACFVYDAYMQDVHGSGNEADDYGMRAALTAALAQQEPRNDALADGEAASA